MKDKEDKIEEIAQIGLTEDEVRAIAREEIEKWKHDAAHTVTQAQVTAQWERDKEAGVALTES